MTKRISVKNLAKEAGLDYDEVLVRLWDAGLNSVIDENSFIARKQLADARSTLGLNKKNEIIRIGFWQKKLALSELEFLELCQKLDISITPSLTKLPKGAVKKLKGYAHSKDIKIALMEASVPQVEEIFDDSDFELPIIGIESEINLLSIDEVFQIHNCLVEDFQNNDDPISPPGVRDPHLLNSAIHRQTTGMGDISKYCTVELCGAALTHSLVNNHPFYNGNKRTALVALLVFLNKNNLVLDCEEKDLFKFMLKIAQHSLLSKKSATSSSDKEVAVIAEWIFNNSRRLEFGDRTIAWRKLDSILRNYNCEIVIVNGTRIRIEREVKKRFFGLISKKIHTQVAKNGRDADVTVVKKVRKDLRLTEEYGIDSNCFYSEKPQMIDDFINAYRQTLKRLARV